MKRNGTQTDPPRKHPRNARVISTEEPKKNYRCLSRISQNNLYSH